LVVATIQRPWGVANDAFSLGRCSHSFSSRRLVNMNWQTCRTSGLVRAWRNLAALVLYVRVLVVFAIVDQCGW
jgi:hypothetical protein